MLFTLIKNEWIKLFKRTKTWIVFLLFIAVVVLGTVALFYDEKDSKNKDDQNEYAQIQSQLAQLNMEKEQYEEAVKHVGEKDGWKKTLDKEIETTKTQISETIDKDQKAQLEQQLAKLKYMQENNIDKSNEWRVNPYKTTQMLFAILGSALYGAQRDSVDG